MWGRVRNNANAGRANAEAAAADYAAARLSLAANTARAMRMSRQLRAGIVWVNTYRVVSPIAPFGGYKESGYGRESGLQAVYDYTRPKTVWINTSDAPLANPFVMR